MDREAGAMGLMLGLLILAAQIIDLTYRIAWNMRWLGFRKPRVLWIGTEICWELRPVELVALPVSAFAYMATTGDPWWARMIVLAIDAYFGWLCWTDKDNRWKKRRKKLLAKVKEAAGRLVVVPLPAPGPA